MMPPPWFISILTMILSLAPKSMSANDENASSCSARIHCGDIQYIGYPFWGLDRPESCGYPGFRLNCNDDNPEISIMAATYRVLHIDTSSQLLQVARMDYTESICPTYLLNSSFYSTPFAYNRESTLDIWLFYGCQPLTDVQNNSTSTHRISSQFECTINETNIIGYYLTRNVSETSFDTVIRNTLGSCNYSVSIPVMSSEVPSLEEIRNLDILEEALSLGFELRWYANDSMCKSCEDSGGQCGHDLITAEFICYCSDESYPRDCRLTLQGEKKDVGLRVGLGIAGAVIAGILIGIGILCFKRRQPAAGVKNKYLPTPPSSTGPSTTSTTHLSQTIPSYSPSNYDIEKESTYFGTHVFRYQELEEATDNFNPDKQLGEGGFGTVYYGMLSDGREVAVKRLYKTNFKRVDQYMNEIEIFPRIRHPNLVTLYGCTSKRSTELLLVYEYIPNGTVADHLYGKLSNSGFLTWPIRLSIAVETANALAHLHASDIIHRDVKTANILLDNSFEVKVADFGLSRLFPDGVTHVSTAPQGTPGYVDPEYFQCYQLSEKSDVYSYGVVLFELISAKPAVDTSRHRDDINLANMGMSRIRNHALHELVDPSLRLENDYATKKMVTAVAELASRCLQQERDMRPSMEQVLQTLIGIQGEQIG
ncbi:hypothetical protein ERO13_A12G054600v2 [Gossypium hirsutum]|uniref:non-specific serine/threonine protein kinase n=1 Tax=Gossypium hirsutum TaxID=3635 RepID=A0ABM2ZAZ6_GOSHI|nr:LEAF RUST 10 DISEASE-RESISTANCE LOCUS RECEPTOR-LIKE PROTEIN KINASE-like 1.3 [Gossypium hirsutum]KAG4168926.1 hypothetical protein ERO13_A12G054600v2 [Gossypium hirsutum]